MTELIPWIILVPLTGSVLTFVCGRRAAVYIGLFTAALTALLCGLLAWMVSHNGDFFYEIGNWPVPLGIRLYVDGLACIMLLMTGLTGFFVSFYARFYYREHGSDKPTREGEIFWPPWLFLWGSLNAIYLSADLFNMYVLLELMGLSAVGLVALTGQRAVLLAGMRYLIAAMVGSLTYLMGVALLYAKYSTLDIYLVGELATHNSITSVAFALMALGLIMKTALFPLHFWLPPAHGGSTAPVSAILSALVVKASFYLLLRLWFEVYYDTVTIPAGQLLGALGALAVLWGSFQAFRQKRLKMLVAYSTVAQLGYLFVIFPITAGLPPPIDGQLPPWVTECGQGVMYHAIAHALSKAAIFLAAGVMVHAIGSDHLDRMSGMAERMPLTTFTMAIAGISLMGLPPSGGFIGKWLIMHAVIGAGQWWWAAVIMTGSLMTAGYIFLMLRHAFEPVDDPNKFRHVPAGMAWSAMILACIGILIGIRASNVLELLMIGTPFALDATLPGGMP